MGMTACAFTGHRPSRFSFGYDEDAPKCVALKARLNAEIERLIGQGVCAFLTGMALGCDQWAAEAVLALRARHPHIALIAVLPCEEQANRWSAAQRERYFGILSRADDVVTLQGRYTPDCLFRRNRHLVDRADHLLAVYDGVEKGGTHYTVAYARKMGRAATYIHPDTCESTRG